jgi:hypothetical protein
MVNEYRTARLAQEYDRDVAVGCYGPGSEEWDEHPRPITFKEWLTALRGQNDHSQGDDGW